MAASSAAVTSSVLARPPRSGVWRRRSSSTLSTARWTAAAASGSPRCSSMSAPVQTWPTGVAIPCPAMSGAEPWTGSNIEGWARSGLGFAAGAIPIEPATAAVRSLRMSPKRFEPTITSSDSGARTTRAHSASIRTRSTSTAAKSAATASTTSSQNGIVWMSPLDFVAETSRPLRRAAGAAAPAPDRHRVVDPVGVRRRDGPPAAPPRELERVADDPLGATGGEDRELRRELALLAGVEPPADFGVLALDVLAYDDEV